MTKLFYKLGNHPNNNANFIFTAKHLQLLQAKVGQDIGYSYVVGVVKASPTQFVPAMGDIQYYIHCSPAQRSKVAEVLLKDKIAYVSMIGREEVQPNSEV